MEQKQIGFSNTYLGFPLLSFVTLSNTLNKTSNTTPITTRPSAPPPTLLTKTASVVTSIPVSAMNTPIFPLRPEIVTERDVFYVKVTCPIIVEMRNMNIPNVYSSTNANRSPTCPSAAPVVSASKWGVDWYWGWIGKRSLPVHVVRCSDGCRLVGLGERFILPLVFIVVADFVTDVVWVVVVGETHNHAASDFLCQSVWWFFFKTYLANTFRHILILTQFVVT